MNTDDLILEMMLAEDARGVWAKSHSNSQSTINQSSARSDWSKKTKTDDNINDMIKHGINSVKNTIKEHPYTAVGVTTGLLAAYSLYSVLKKKRAQALKKKMSTKQIDKELSKVKQKIYTLEQAKQNKVKVK